ncbi:MAG: hypothetical protein K1X75_03550 [Leptospirales bacterium]|nr:hypothetical protein [Leptospirales bacterium]
MVLRFRAGFGLLILALLTAAQCRLQLAGERSSSRVSLEGLWYSPQLLEGESGALLYIKWPGGDDRPYQFTLLELTYRDLTISGRRIYFQKREGLGDTSASELLLEQRRFTAGYYQSEEAESYQAGKLQAVLVERSFENSTTPDLLQISENGSELKGEVYHFVRATGPSAEPSAGLVLSSQGDALFGICFDPALAAVAAQREVFVNQQRQGRVRIAAIRDFWFDARGATAPPGAALLMPGWRPGRNSVRRMTREEALRRLQRGETLSREEMIRALGSDGSRR